MLDTFVFVGGSLRLRDPEKPLGVMLIVGNLSLALYGAGRIALNRRIERSVGYWSQRPGCVQFRSSRPNGLQEYLPGAIVSMGALTAAGIQLFFAAASPNDVWTVASAVVMLLGWLVGCIIIPAGGRGSPEVVPTPEAIWIWVDGYT